MQHNRILVILLWFIRGVTIGLTLLTLYLVFNLYFFPSGKLDVAYDFSEDSEYISHLGPWQRLLPPEEINGVWSQEIKDDLVYFDVRNPRWFQSLTVQLTFQNPDQPLFEIGARVNNKDGYYILPIQNKLIDNLDWDKIQEGQISLWQKTGSYKTISDWELNVSDSESIGQYFYTRKVDRIIPDYKSSDDLTVIDYALRGDHTIYTYIKDEVLDFRFTKTDINKYAGPDPVNIDIYRQVTNEHISHSVISDDGEEGFGEITAQPLEDSTTISDLPEGVYRIEISGNNDYIINSISTKQKLLVFSKNIFPADNEEYLRDFESGSRHTTLITDSVSVRFKTSHPAGLQTVTAGGQKVNIESANTYYGVQLSGLSEVYLPLNDVQIESDGLFAFSKDQYFYPYPLNVVNIKTDTDIESLDYVISNYISPVESGDWLVKSQTFDIEKLYRDDNGKIRFRLSAPGLSERGDTIRIAEIRVMFEKPPLTFDNFLERVKNYLKKLIKKG